MSARFGFHISIIGLAFLVSCNKQENIAEFCMHRFIDFENNVAMAQSQLEELPTNEERKIASEGEALDHEPLRESAIDPEVREHWVSWAEDNIKQTESWLNLMQDQNMGYANRDHVHRVVNQLVSFWGFADRANTKEMKKSLIGLKQETESFKKYFCTQAHL